MPLHITRRVTLSLCAAVALQLVVACVTPTDVCGCVALPSVLRVSGNVRDVQGKPVVEARVSILNRAVGFPDASFSTAGRRAFVTDSLGNFFAETSTPTPTRSEIRGYVVRRASTDTVVLVLGVADLRPPTGRIDTLRVAVVTP